MIAPPCQTRFGSPEPPPPGRAPPCGWTTPRASTVTGCVWGALADAPAAPSVQRIRAAAASGAATRSRACRADWTFDMEGLRGDECYERRWCDVDSPASSRLAQPAPPSIGASSGAHQPQHLPGPPTPGRSDRCCRRRRSEGLPGDARAARPVCPDQETAYPDAGPTPPRNGTQ